MRFIDPTKPVQGQATTQSVRDNFAAAKEQLDALQHGGWRHVYTGTYFVAPFARTAIYLITPGNPYRSSSSQNFPPSSWWQYFRPSLSLQFEGPTKYGGVPNRYRWLNCAWCMFTAQFLGHRTTWHGLYQPVGSATLTPLSFELAEMGTGLYPFYLEDSRDPNPSGGGDYTFDGGYWERIITDWRPISVFAVNA